MEWTRVHGILTQGYHVASGPSSDYPYGALDRQRPIFTARGLDLSNYFNGTLNINIQPNTFVMQKPEYTFQDVEWTDLHPPEHFSFSRCKVIYRDVEYDGWVYYPHPETKLRNFQNPSLLEVIAMSIPEINYGDALDVMINDEEITIIKSEHKKPEVHVNRKRFIAGIVIGVVLLILGLIGVGAFLMRAKPNEAKVGQHSPVSELTYCNANANKPCIVSFGLDADSNMIVNLLMPDSSYPDFSLKIGNDYEANSYICQKTASSSTHAYCNGKAMQPGTPLQFNLVSNIDQSVLAEGKFSIIGLMLMTPQVDATETETPTPTLPEPAQLLESPTSTPLTLGILTPTPTAPVTTRATQSYPNPSYP